ncbi:MAG: OmpA family protein [Proteobacteria bacterium]|nr:OmpA family protein [Pseudomonadota bacterium]MBU4470358.1 OmpA family protein [Pseudomonadota bacterium]MCG2752769.1 OmpA family protein [Desulfobacteraceae bacterium]
MTGKIRNVIHMGMGLFIPCFMVFAGCGPSLQETRARDHLANAKAAQALARANPNVQNYAQIPLMDADKTLAAASRAKKYDEMDHLAYLSEKKTRIAIATADEQMAENAKKALGNEAELMMAQGREREETANLEALEAKAEAWTQAYKAEMATAEVDKLQQEISEMQGRITDRGIVITLGDMLFATGSATLSADADNQINKLAAFMMKYPDRKLIVEGYTDSIGAEAKNLDLSLKRALAVSDRLMSREISSDRITIKGYGEESPVAGNDNSMGRQQNRRVEVVILNEESNLQSPAR